MKYILLILCPLLLFSSCNKYLILNDEFESIESLPLEYKKITREVRFTDYWKFHKSTKLKTLTEKLYSFHLLYNGDKITVNAIGMKQPYIMVLEKYLQKCIDKNKLFNDKKTQSIHIKIVIPNNQYRGKYIPVRKFKTKDKKDEIFYIRIFLFPPNYD